ncbi:MAG: PDZ domain-containing protein [Nanoarchaeota archaeon]|nr:PDZ domain-containing protein [Nanoarchaeota archaeon]
MTFKMWVLVVVLVAALFAINPTGYFQNGVLVKSVDRDSSAYLAGLSQGDIITEINGAQITSMQEYSAEIESLFSNVKAIEWVIETNKETYKLEGLTLDLGVDEDLRITEALNLFSEIPINEILIRVNGNEITAQEGFYSLKNDLEPKVKLSIKAKDGTSIFFTNSLDFTVSEIPSTRVKAGLDLAGGARALVMPEKKLTVAEMDDLIAVSRERFNVYGIADMNIRPASDLSGNNYMIVEVAGASPRELQDLIGQQGKFEAKIGNESVFIGGKDDIKSVCRNDASCAGIQSGQETSDGYYYQFQFTIYLSPQAAQRQADITSKLDINMTADGQRILSETLDLYLDDQLVDSLQIDAGLKGNADATQIAINGPGAGTTKEEAFNNANANMLKLQTILITGSLPFKLEVAKLDSISPVLGDEFIKNIFLAALGAALGVALVIFIRYKSISYTVPMLSIAASEIFIILGVAAAINWNLDLASIAGIIAAIGMGVNDQIIIVDESRNQENNRSSSLKERVKRAFFIIFGCFSTMLVAMIPLWWAGAGMIRGFAVTTIIGISIGVFITRPAFSDIISQIIAKE